ncbi:MAG TPA: DUF1573 domain-containing protein [Gemmataceae bacterium]|nr:DUF1573 domain-containing protein [Gemmataceae bacterium]
MRWVVAASCFVVATNNARADLLFAEPHADAGTVRSSAPMVHHFTFVNQGPETVEILRVLGSCGCLKPNVAQTTYKPGEQGKVDLEVHTLSQAPGPHTWSVHLSYQCGNELREAELQLRARVVTEVMVQPAAIVFHVDKATGREVTVTDFRKKPLTVTDVRGSSTGLKAHVAERGHDRKGNTVYRIQLEVTEDYPDGRHEEYLDIYSDDPAYGNLRVPLTIVKRAPQHLTVAPDHVTLEAHNGQPLPARIVLLRDNSDEKVVIEHVLVDDAAITCTWAQGPNNMATLKIRVDRAQIHGDSLRSNVQVLIRKPAPETLTIPVVCTID